MNTKKLTYFTSLIISFSFFITIICFTGCENSNNDSNSTTSTDLIINPVSISFNASDTTNIVFTITGGTPVYTWSVNDTTLGTIISSGDTAIYTSTTNQGNNFITIIDANTNSISATIIQN